MGRRIEVDLAKESTEAGDWTRIPLYLLPKAIDLKLSLSQGEVNGEYVVGKNLCEDADSTFQLFIERLEVVLVKLK